MLEKERERERGLVGNCEDELLGFRMAALAQCFRNTVDKESRLVVSETPRRHAEEFDGVEGSIQIMASLDELWTTCRQVERANRCVSCPAYGLLLGRSSICGAGARGALFMQCSASLRFRHPRDFQVLFSDFYLRATKLPVLISTLNRLPPPF